MGIKQPPAYQHPNKRKRHDTVAEKPAPAPVETVENPIKEKRRKKPITQKPVGRDAERSVMIRLVVHPPAKGQLKLYDKMIESAWNRNKLFSVC